MLRDSRSCNSTDPHYVALVLAVVKTYILGYAGIELDIVCVIVFVKVICIQ